MKCIRGCEQEAIFYVKKYKYWTCHKIPSKCPIVKKKIGISNSIALKGKKSSEECKQKISKGLKLAYAERRRLPIKHSEEIKQKISAKNKGNIPWNKGKKGLQIAWNKGIKKKELPAVIDRNDPIYSDFKKYRNRIQTRTGKIYEKYKKLINPENHMLGKCGIKNAYHIDHIVGVRIGFDLGLTVEAISSIENLRTIPWLENAKKYDGKGRGKSSEFDAIELINLLESKYGKIK